MIGRSSLARRKHRRGLTGALKIVSESHNLYAGKVSVVRGSDRLSPVLLPAVMRCVNGSRAPEWHSGNVVGRCPGRSGTLDCFAALAMTRGIDVAYFAIFAHSQPATACGEDPASLPEARRLACCMAAMSMRLRSGRSASCNARSSARFGDSSRIES